MISTVSDLWQKAASNVCETEENAIVLGLNIDLMQEEL